MSAMDSEFTLFVVVGVTLVGLFAAILYYFLRFFFKAGRYDEELTKPSQEVLSPPDSVGDRGETREAALTAPASTPAPDLSRPSLLEKDLAVALAPTRASLFGRIKTLFKNGQGLSSDDRENLEEILYTSDLGPKTVERLMEAVDERMAANREVSKSNLEDVRQALKDEISAIFSQVSSSPNGTSEFPLALNVNQVLHLDRDIANKPLIWLIVGVNGVGKTTTIGKLAHAVAKAGKKVLVAAGDTFRAAAGDQLKVWSERAQVEIFSPTGVSDPSAVAFDACQMAKARGHDVVIIDTAGRLHTQAHLMEELRKMKRVVQKVVPEGPHETWLVLDANSGQNALMQARHFHDILELSGVVLTKMDGTAKGGVAVGLACELKLPIRLMGVGEGIDDLRPFHSEEFVHSIL